MGLRVDSGNDVDVRPEMGADQPEGINPETEVERLVLSWRLAGLLLGWLWFGGLIGYFSRLYW